MSKFNAELPGADGRAPKAAAPGSEAPAEKAAPKIEGSDIVTVAATIGAVGVVAAIVDIALIPGMVIGVAAALAPKFAPKLGERLEPLFETTVKGAVKLTRRARSAVAEAQERVGDITAEIDAEEAAKHDHAEKAVA